MIPVETPPVDGPEALSPKTELSPQTMMNVMGLTVFVLEEGQEARWQPVSEIPEGLRQLVSVNSAGSIPIKVPENTLPVGNVLPKARKLF